MTIHFICRGNTFRSIIAEAYLKSLRLPGLEVYSSGTVASEYKTRNAANFQAVLALLGRHGIAEFAKSHYADQLPAGQAITGDVIVCMNQIVYDECQQLGQLPEQVIVWQVMDIGEPGRVPQTAAEKQQFMEAAYQEIVGKVTELVGQLDLRQRIS